MKIIQLPETVHSDVEPLDEIINVIMPCKFIIYMYHDAKIFVWCKAPIASKVNDLCQFWRYGVKQKICWVSRFSQLFTFEILQFVSSDSKYRYIFEYNVAQQLLTSKLVTNLSVPKAAHLDCTLDTNSSVVQFDRVLENSLLVASKTVLSWTFFLMTALLPDFILKKTYNEMKINKNYCLFNCTNFNMRPCRPPLTLAQRQLATCIWEHVCWNSARRQD